MAIKDKKKKVMGKVAALNKLTDKGNNRVDGIKSKINSKKDAINNKKNKVMEFITSLAMAITSFEDLKKELTDTIANELPYTESVIKNELKKQLKECISCGIDPSVPDWLKTSGVTLDVDKIDFYGMFKSAPDSLGGKLVYNDVASGLNSTDMNTFIYNVIEQNRSAPEQGGTTFPWGSSTVNRQLLDVKFTPVLKESALGKSTFTSNQLNFTINPASHNMNLTEFNNKLIDSVSLFGPNGSDKVIVKLMQDMLGTLNKMIPRPKAQLIEEEKMRKSLECMINAEAEVSDSFFTFSNEDLELIEREAINKKKGIRKAECCRQTTISLNPEDLINAQTSIQNSVSNPPPGFTSETAKIVEVSRVLDDLSTKATGLSIDPIDLSNLKMDFILTMIKNYAMSIVSFVISPKLLVVFAINHQLIYGQGTSYKNGLDFLEKNKNILKPIFDAIKKIIIKKILIMIIKKLSTKIAIKILDDRIEKNKSYTKQLKVLNGITEAVTLMVANLK